MACKHKHIHLETEEMSRMYGNNYDIVVYDYYVCCDDCDEIITRHEKVLREEKDHV